jgi:hypothetical protein
MSGKIGFGDACSASVKANRAETSGLIFSGWVKTVCRDKDGNVKWVDEGPNHVVDDGINWIFDNDIAAATLYVGLLGSSPSTATTWDMTNASGAEAAGYDEANRVTWGQTLSSKTLTNSTAADFTMDGVDTTIGGAFITTDNTKDGSSGTLIAAKAFTGGNKTVADNDTLSVTYTITGSDGT